MDRKRFIQQSALLALGIGSTNLLQANPQLSAGSDKESYPAYLKRLLG